MPRLDHPHRQATADQVAVAALAHGVEPPPPATARVLELGCGAGATLLGTAVAAPGATLVGVDADAEAIGVARALAAGAGLAVEFHPADLRALPALGTFDYVIAHGVYSWVAPDVQDALLAAIDALLAPGGLGYVSHAALPAGHLLRILREAGLRGPGGAGGARELLAGPLTSRAGSGREADWYGAFLRHELPPLLALRPEELEEDLFAPEWRPVWFHEFAAHLARHDLAYVGESRLLEPVTRVRRPGAQARLEAAANGDRVAFEQLRDLADGRHFREAVVCRAGTAVRDRPDPGALRRLRFTALEVPERELPAGAEQGAAIARARTALLAARPGFPSLAEIGAGGDVVLEALGSAQVLAFVAPPPAAAASERPVASSLARAQAARGQPVTTLTHAVLALDPAGTALVALLDGTRDRAAIAVALAQRTGLVLSPDGLGAALDALGRAGVLVR